MPHQVLPVNPAAAVRGPKHVVTTGATPVLAPAEARRLLAAIDAPALDAAALERAAIHIARPLGLDPATTPVLDARLDDGSRVAICVPPASPHVAITVRRFGKRSFSAAQLVEQGALPEHIRHAAERTLHTRRNILVSGGTGSGKTTLLNALIALIPDDERIVAIEDTLELRIDSANCVRFEARGLQQGAVTIRDLSYGTVRTGDSPQRRHQGPRRAHRAARARRPRCHRHGRTNLGPLAARPHLSPVPGRLPGRPTSDPGGPGLRRLYGLFSGCGVAGAGTPVGEKY